MAAAPRPGVIPRSNLPDDFILDAWYVAAWGDEVTREPLRRVFLGQPVVLFRKQDGAPAALADRCIHRAFPLSLGKLEGDSITCAYHGFVFDAGGACTWVPGQESIPKSARVQAYPLVESGPYVWIWMGDPVAADPATIPDHHWTYDPGWASIKDMATVAARYGVLLDNLMDLSHETFVHEGTIGSPEVADTPITTEVSGGIVRSWKHMENVPVPPFYQRIAGMTGTIDRWQDIEFHVPSFYTLHVRVAPSGASDDVAFFTKIMYALTPETKHTTHDFWVISRNRNLDQPGWRDTLAVDNQNAVLREDIAALEALERNLPADGHWQELSINIDRAGLQWRRVFRERLNAGNAAREPAVSSEPATARG